ncbi:MarR family winged helix-turn-helix transcriptional regulator [Microbacterium sp. SS28]|uniref:MarR family winged helix-turn-helix transcriptional regulator n=1 Tax=Microbacterium sp. SS28 TaxID=2919948 RepID=UPI001FAA3C94|nr:MarR family transcriptional regulator [Microbacterium sp. SS28]
MSRSTDFFDAVVGYETALWGHVAEVLEQRGRVSLGQLGAMRIIHRFSGTCRVHEVGAGLQITVGAASKLVDRLEQSGLAQRHPNPEDRRSSLVILTAEGEKAHDEAMVVFDEALTAHLAEAEEDAATVAALLDRLRRRL